MGFEVGFLSDYGPGTAAYDGMARRRERPSDSTRKLATLGLGRCIRESDTLSAGWVRSAEFFVIFGIEIWVLSGSFIGFLPANRDGDTYQFGHGNHVGLGLAVGGLTVERRLFRVRQCARHWVFPSSGSHRVRLPLGRMASGCARAAQFGLASAVPINRDELLVDRIVAVEHEPDGSRIRIYVIRSFGPGVPPPRVLGPRQIAVRAPSAPRGRFRRSAAAVRHRWGEAMVQIGQPLRRGVPAGREFARDRTLGGMSEDITMGLARKPCPALPHSRQERPPT